MFSLCMVESGADEVNLRGITSIGLKQALDFAYTGQVLLGKKCVCVVLTLKICNSTSYIQGP